MNICILIVATHLGDTQKDTFNGTLYMSPDPPPCLFTQELPVVHFIYDLNLWFHVKLVVYLF